MLMLMVAFLMVLTFVVRIASAALGRSGGFVGVRIVLQLMVVV
jgi:hypothetical protein